MKIYYFNIKLIIHIIDDILIYNKWGVVYGQREHDIRPTRKAIFMATKDDLVNLATKNDLENLATKDDLDLLGEELHQEIQSVYNEVKNLKVDLRNTELLTARNTYDIAKLKLIKYDEL
jgi:hypothetical protein